MGDDELGEKPTPTTDPDPDQAPGGPADAIPRDKDDFPIVTPDGPLNADVDPDAVPDEIEQPEETDEEAKDVPPEDESPA